MAAIHDLIAQVADGVRLKSLAAAPGSAVAEPPGTHDVEASDLDIERHFDILEPHDPSRDDNVDKARALARFAERHGGQFGRIQLIRKRRTAGGGAQIVRLEINRRDTWQQVLLVTTATQLDRLFHGDH